MRVLYRAVVSVLVIGLIGSTSIASAAIIGQSILNADGSYTYDYSIDPEGKVVTNWGLDFNLPSADWQLNDVIVPPGWIVDWSVASGKPDLDFIDVSGLGAGPNDVLTGFSLHTFYQPGQVGFVEFGFLPGNGNAEFGAQGSVSGPVGGRGGPTVPDTMPGFIGGLVMIGLIALGRQGARAELNSHL